MLRAPLASRLWVQNDEKTIIPLHELVIGTCGSVKTTAFQSQPSNNASVRDSEPGHVRKNVRILWAAMNWVQVQRGAIIIHLISIKMLTNSHTLKKTSAMVSYTMLMKECHNCITSSTKLAPSWAKRLK
jgi:hypothetical protein